MDPWDWLELRAKLPVIPLIDVQCSHVTLDSPTPGPGSLALAVSRARLREPSVVSQSHEPGIAVGNPAM